MKSARLSVIKQLVVLLLVVEIINFLTARSLISLGIFPRQIDGLMGIIFAPFIHGSISHFLANIVPLVVFTFLLNQYGQQRFLKLSAFLIITTGILVWLFARSSFHVGASGVIYGYFGYLLLIGWVSKQLVPMLMSLFVGLFYGGMIFGVLPLNQYVSWESHLFGFLMGLLATRLFPIIQRAE